jgi:hypothetical protein
MTISKMINSHPKDWKKVATLAALGVYLTYLQRISLRLGRELVN